MRASHGSVMAKSNQKGMAQKVRIVPRERPSRDETIDRKLKKQMHQILNITNGGSSQFYLFKINLL